MSFKAFQWAMKQELPAMQKMVLVTLANRFNDDTGECYPSHELLATESGMTSRSVVNQIEKLEQAKLLKVIRSTDDKGNKNSNRYILNFKVVNVVQEGTERDSHETVNEPVNKNTITTTREGTILNDVQREIFVWASTHDYWHKATSSEEEFLKALCSPKGGMRRQFENRFKEQTGGSNATHKKPTRPAKVSAAERVEQALAERYGNAAENVIELDQQHYRTA